MARPPAKKPAARKPAAKPTAPRVVKRPLIWRDRPSSKRTPEERKARAIELCLQAVAGGWTLVRFSKHSHVSKSSLMRWLSEDTVQPRFVRAMQIKALSLPDRADEILNKIITGKIDPKAGGVALRHMEFRMMREVKTIYNPGRAAEPVGDIRQIPDDQIDTRLEELMAQHSDNDPAGG